MSFWRRDKEPKQAPEPKPDRPEPRGFEQAFKMAAGQKPPWSRNYEIDGAEWLNERLRVCRYGVGADSRIVGRFCPATNKRENQAIRFAEITGWGRVLDELARLANVPRPEIAEWWLRRPRHECAAWLALATWSVYQRKAIK